MQRSLQTASIAKKRILIFFKYIKVMCSISMLGQLKQFCKDNGFEFPKFSPCYTSVSVRYQVEWYSRTIYTSEWFSTDDEALKNCVIYLSEWLKNEKNYLNLLDYEDSTRMDIV